MSTEMVGALGVIEFCGLDELRYLTEEELDLGRIAIAVAHADRRHQRSDISWHREVRCEIPVSKPKNCAALKTPLVETLNWLTGDRWTIQFQKGTATAETSQSNLWPPGGGPVVCFSGGVDSFAAACSIANADGSVRLLSAETSTQGKGLSDKVARLVPKSHLVRVGFHVNAGSHAEPSYRTRTFCFFLLAAIAANAAGVRRVIVGENGQGILGPSLVTRYGEHTHYGAHPALGWRIRNLLRGFLGKARGEPEIVFDFSNIWRTKGEVVGEVVRLGHQASLGATSSCPAPPARQGRPGAPPMCGACAGCLLRRMSFLANGFDDGPADCLWHDVHAATLAASCDPKFPTSGVDETNARGAVLLLDQLARASAHRGVDSVAARLVTPLGIDMREGRERIRAVLDRHTVEWQAFVDFAGPESWIATTLKECRER